MVSLAAQPTKWTAVENIIKPLEPEVVRQMLLSEQVWIYDGSSTLPINLKSNTLQFKKSVNDKLISYTISFEYAFDKINNII